VRNIIVSEFSGISENEVFDTTPYAMALTDVVVPEADSYLMPRKMKIAFSSDENFTDYAGINDVGLVAQIRDGKRGFKVYVGGGAGSKPSVGWLYKEFLPAEDLYALIKGMKDFFNAHGNRKDKYKARIRFIFYKLGQEETFRLIDQYVEKAKATGIRLEVKEDAYLPTVRNARTTVLPFTWGNIWLDDEESVTKLKAILELQQSMVSIPSALPQGRTYVSAISQKVPLPISSNSLPTIHQPMANLRCSAISCHAPVPTPAVLVSVFPRDLPMPYTRLLNVTISISTCLPMHASTYLVAPTSADNHYGPTSDS
jgi:hypothetical protein